MAKIAEQIQKLREQEKRLERETRKVEFLTHILESAKEYKHATFTDVKQDVTSLLENFVKKTIEAIEAGTEVTITVGPPTLNIVPMTPQAPSQPQVAGPAQLQPVKPAGDSVGPNEKLAFALDNRHLGGKKVSVQNDKNITIRGEVVGLDAPFVIVRTETGPTIKVPLEKVSLD